MTRNHLHRDENGYVNLPDAPGLGIEIDLAAVHRYSVSLAIQVKDKVLFDSESQKL